MWLEITERGKPGVGPWKVYVQDDWDTNFAGVSGTPFADWASGECDARHCARLSRDGDDGEGRAVLRVLHRPAETHCRPW